MSHGRVRAWAVAGALVLAAAPGCGLGAGQATDGDATLTVTRGYGAEQLLETTQSDPAASETVIRMLDRDAEIETRYSGGFVQSINGIDGEVEAGRSFDWFFFVNGIESSIGAAEAEVRGGDRIWWDYRDWSDALRTPAVVGSWPEPFLQQSATGDRQAVEIECFGPRDPCARVRDRLEAAGVTASVVTTADGAGPPVLRLLVGTWGQVRSDPLAAEIERGPQFSGVFARFGAREGGWSLELLDAQASVSRRYQSGAGLVAAMREGDQPPTWLVTGVDRAGVEEAVALLDSADLRDRYAVAGHAGRESSVPAGAPK